MRGGEILALSGDLGAGKTTFIQGLAKGLGINQKIVSPTFILMRSYQGKFDFYHLDLYRLEGNIEAQVRDLGVFDLMKDSKNVIAIEWAEKLDGWPEDIKWIKFENVNDDERKIILE